MTVVLLHALPLTGAMWADQLAWLPGGSFAPTLYDYGDSISDWAGGVLDEIGDDGELVVVGASVGGFVALEMARLAPRRVASVVLVGSKAGVRRDDAARDHALRVLADDGVDGAWREFWRPLFGSRTAPEVVERARGIAGTVARGSLERGVRAFFDRPDLSEFARRWPGRLDVISGDQDATPSPETCAAVARDAPQGRFHLVRDCGHYVSIERPTTFNDLLRAAVRCPRPTAMKRRR